MKTRLSGYPHSKVTFLDERKAKVDLYNGETWIVGFPSLTNYLSGEHFIRLLGFGFDLFWGLSGTLEGDFRRINEYIYHDGYDMMFYIVLEPKRSEERERIGNRIKELRKKKGLDAKELASRIGIDASNLSRIEQGRYSVGLDILSKIASALGAKVDIIENSSTIYG